MTCSVSSKFLENAHHKDSEVLVVTFNIRRKRRKPLHTPLFTFAVECAVVFSFSLFFFLFLQSTTLTINNYTFRNIEKSHLAFHKEPRFYVLYLQF